MLVHPPMVEGLAAHACLFAHAIFPPGFLTFELSLLHLLVVKFALILGSYQISACRFFQISATTFQKNSLRILWLYFYFKREKISEFTICRSSELAILEAVVLILFSSLKMEDLPQGGLPPHHSVFKPWLRTQSS